MTALVLSAVLMVPAFGAVKEQAVDTILLEPETLWEDEVPVDLSWKTQQDKGRWIDEMGIAGDSKSLILVINNLETESSEEIPVQTRNGKRAQSSSRELAGNSRLFYYSRCADGGWREVFAVNCYISGGSGEDEDIYGVYRLDSAFGLESDPGSLVSYRQLSQKDYWITDPEDEDFGAIYTAGEEGPGTKEAVRLGEMKAFSNYGMILKPETEGDAYPALVVNCQQASTEDDTFSGIQLSQSLSLIHIFPVQKLRRGAVGTEWDPESRWVVRSGFREILNSPRSCMLKGIFSFWVGRAGPTVTRK